MAFVFGYLVIGVVVARVLYRYHARDTDGEVSLFVLAVIYWPLVPLLGLGLVLAWLVTTGNKPRR